MQANFQLIDTIVLTAYLCGMLAIGFYCAKRNNSTEQFFLGSRSMPWWAVGISIFATQLSAITFISIPGGAFESDWSWLTVNMGIPVVGIVVAYCYLPVLFQRSYTSLYEYLEDRFGVEARVYGAIAYIVMQIGRCAVVLYLPALALAEVTGLPVIWMILCMGVLVTVYTVLGGIEVVIWTDVVQAVILFGGALFALGIMAWQTPGGFEALNNVASENSKFTVVHTNTTQSGDLIWYMLLGAFFANLVPYVSDQTVVQRYFTTKNLAQAQRCLLLGVFFAIPATFLFLYVGTMLFAYYELHPGLLTINPETSGYDRMFPFFIVQQLPAGLSGLLIAAIFAGSMSSLDSSLNSVATVCVNDFYKRFHKPNSTDHECLRLAQLITVIMGCFATIASIAVANTLSKGGEDGIIALDVFMALSGLLGGALAGVFCVGVFTKKANQAGVVVGLVIGTGVLALISFSLNWHKMTYAAVGVMVTFAVSYFISRIAPIKQENL